MKMTAYIGNVQAWSCVGKCICYKIAHAWPSQTNTWEGPSAHWWVIVHELCLEFNVGR
jgi:hypothetical protein